MQYAVSKDVVIPFDKQYDIMKYFMILKVRKRLQKKDLEKSYPFELYFVTFNNLYREKAVNVAALQG